MAEPVTTTQEPIEPIAAHERADEEDEFETSDFDSATLSSSSTSLNTSIYQHAFENGRRVSWTAWSLRNMLILDSIINIVMEREEPGGACCDG